MEELIVSGIISGLEALITEEPVIAAQIRLLMSKTDATADDWKNLRKAVLAKKYSDYDPTPIPLSAEETISQPAPAVIPTAAPDMNPIPLQTAAPSPTPSVPEPAAPSVITSAAAPALSPEPAAVAEVATPAPAPTPSPAIAPVPAFPANNSELAALVAAATPEQLTWLYQAGNQLSHLVNQRWANPS